MSEAISKEAFQALIDRAGLTLTPPQFDELRIAYGYLQAMRERVRKPRGYDAEPAHIFKPAER
ncbi:MAG: hypothetical protein CFE31_07595 [Rhizobiales bacterium PAR1]|nr:MAG: hypothetical protein CFE31_07595 [Rhizobiales bacterium PAR1]